MNQYYKTNIIIQMQDFLIMASCGIMLVLGVIQMILVKIQSPQMFVLDKFLIWFFAFFGVLIISRFFSAAAYQNQAVKK